MKTPDLSIIILSYNTRDLMDACLASVYASDIKPYSVEVIVCDNGSSDNTVAFIKKKYKSVKIIENQKNIGFAAGNNPGIKIAAGRYVLLLNSDTEVFRNTLHDMIKFMDDHLKAGIGTAKLLLSNGLMDPACHRGFPTPWAAATYLLKLEKLFPKSLLFGQYHQGYKDMAKAHEIDSPSGAFFMVRSEVINAVGLLDEDYFMYGEDLDWAYRIKKAGWQVWFNPIVTVLHKKKQSGRAKNDRNLKLQSDRYFYQTMKIFYRKHYQKIYPKIITAIVFSFLDLRLFILSRFGL